MKGKSARFRARRMRLLMTMSASGPVPRSHSPLRLRQVVEFHGTYLLLRLLRFDPLDFDRGVREARS